MHILISGAANGLGAAFLEAYRIRPETKIIALDREATGSTYDNVASHIVDVTSQQSIHRLVHELDGVAINLVIHSVGVRGLVSTIEDRIPGDVAACETLAVMDSTTLVQAFEVNTVGTFMLLRALLPNLQLSANPKVIVMSSRMGSVGNNQLPNRAAGAAYAYRASKAGQNMIIRSLAVDVPGVTFVLCHPGRVETRLVKWKEEGAISAQESVQGILPLIEKWNGRDSGKFYDRFGEPIEW